MLLKFEMRDDVCDVGLGTVYARCGHRLIQKLPGRTGKGFALKIFFVSGLLPNE
jgi:hypothetical protein